MNKSAGIETDAGAFVRQRFSIRMAAISISDGENVFEYFQVDLHANRDWADSVLLAASPPDPISVILSVTQSVRPTKLIPWTNRVLLFLLQHARLGGVSNVYY